MLGLSPYRLLDQDYQGFLSLIGRQLRVLLTDAAARENEQHQMLVLADLDRAKTRFYQNVSHELRTPLTLLLAPLQDLLAAQGEHRRGRDDLEAAVRAAERLRVMVDALLDFSGAEGGVMLPDRRAVDLGVLTTEATAMFRSTAERAGLSFTVQVPSEPLTAVVDRSMWSTIVTNLVSNALKYSSAGGGVQVTLDSLGTSAVLTVMDQGMGIDADHQARVFERFYRAEPGNPASGAGIGLALVADLVRLHDGHVDLASEPGSGTTVTVTVPLPAGSTHPLVTERRSGVEAEPGPRVLVVEDDPDLRAYLTRLLLADGWSVDAAPDAEAALPLARGQEPPAVVITDIMLPGRSGLYLLGQLRQDAGTARLPILLITGRGGADAASEGLASGADDYITKPFSSRELLARVRANHELHALRESAVETAQARADQMRQGLHSNRTIGTAVGILMGRHRLTADQAFRLLTAASQNHNSKLRDIAAVVTETGGLPYRPTDVDDLVVRVTAR
jgi:signal transduction histidine kinase/DNA-binding response OmpR family regulator